MERQTARETASAQQRDDQTIEDTYFLDVRDALAVALKQNSIECDGFRRLQVCYFDGSDFPESPANLIGIPLADFSRVFSGSMLPLPTKIQCTRDELERGDVLLAFYELLADLSQFREEHPTGDFRFGHDAYFFSAKDAYRDAIQQKLVKLGSPTVFGLQICYYDGEAFEDAPDNLVHLPAEQLSDALVDMPTRLPTSIRIPLGTPIDVSRRMLSIFEQVMSQASQDKRHLLYERLQLASQLTPRGNGTRLKILLATSRFSQVLQFETLDLARAFESLGHETCIAIERNPMEQMFEFELVKAYLAFAPDIFIVINNLRNQWIHPDVAHVVWYQDLMKPLIEGAQLPVRGNDQFYSASIELDGYLHSCGVEKPQRQSFCVNTDVFYAPRSPRRHKRIVFVGSAYAPQVSKGAKIREMARELAPRIAQGEVFSHAEIEAMADQIGVNREQAFWTLYHYLTRDQVVRWMCEQLPSMELEVQVYGRYWGDDPAVAPYFHGEIAHGEALAEIYRESQFALVCHPFDLNSQRLVEVAACGCTPVVYDCRRVADPPHWDEQCLYFNTAQQLSDLFEGEIVQRDPSLIVAGKTYREFAKRIIRQREARQTS